MEPKKKQNSVCLKIGNVTNGEGFSRRRRLFDTTIRCVFQGKSTLYDRGEGPPLRHASIFQTRHNELAVSNLIQEKTVYFYAVIALACILVWLICRL